MVGPAAAQATPEPAATQALSEADYVSTVDQLPALNEKLIGLVQVGGATFFGVVLTILAGAGYVLVKLTPTKADDELVERVVRAVFDRLNTPAAPKPVTGADVSRDEAEAEG